MNEFTYDGDEKTMIFTADAKRQIRVAFYDGQVWYAIHDIAKLLRYRAPGKAANSREYGARLVRVPHISPNVRGFTNCNCITKDPLKRFLKMQTDEHELCDWIMNSVIPKAEKQFAEQEEPATKKDQPEESIPYLASPVTAIIAALDRVISEAVLLKRELQ